MFKRAFQESPNLFLRCVKQIVDLRLVYRSRVDKPPITPSEIERLNELLRDLGYEITSLKDPTFLSRLAQDEKARQPIQKEPASAGKNGNEFIDPAKLDSLSKELMSLENLMPQDRGYRFEAFLNRLFDIYGMAPKQPFRNRGEQIDGSFIHRHETYLLEAKWQSKEIAVRDLYTFASKVETKASWARGLFISESGYTPEGLFAFRQGKPTSIICMNGLDLFLILHHRLALEEVLDRKKRHAAETGAAFIEVRDLYQI